MLDEVRIRALIEAGVESDQVEFKASLDVSTRRHRAQLAKLVSALANSPGEDHDGWSFVVLGARPRELIGGVSDLADDNHCAGIGRSLEAYLDPPVRFRVWSFEDPHLGWFGALAIPPRLAVTGPHFIARDLQDEGFSVRKGECYVRVGEETRLAQRADYHRIYQAFFAMFTARRHL